MITRVDSGIWEEIEFDVTKGWPAGSKLYYKCTKCGSLVPSLPSQAELDLEWECSCGNLYVDEDAGRMGADDPSCVKLLKKLT